MTPRLFLDQPLNEPGRAELDERARHYLTTVLRLKNDAPVRVFNGDGKEYHGVLHCAGRKHWWIDLHHAEEVSRDSTLSLSLAQVIARGERMDFAIQKAVELGVTAIIPLFSTRCEVHLPPQRQHKRLHHWRQIMISACEQCGRTTLPRLAPPVPLSHWLDETPSTHHTPTTRLVLDPAGTVSLPQATRPPSRNYTVLVGPEGGLTEEELAQCQKRGFHRVRLGPRTLRTETAGLAVLAALQALHGDFGMDQPPV